MFRNLYWISALVLLSACGTAKKGFTEARQQLLDNKALQTAHTGISIFDPATGKYIFNYQGDKYFVPASNTKIPTCYAAMKYLGDSLVAFRYVQDDTAVYLLPAGDPTLLHRDYKKQKAIEWLRATGRSIYVAESNWQDTHWGSGWSWTDYLESYMPERSPLPVYGNVLRWIKTEIKDPYSEEDEMVSSVLSEPSPAWPVEFSIDDKDTSFSIDRTLGENVYTIHEGKQKQGQLDMPFVTHGLQSALELMTDTVGRSLTAIPKLPGKKGTLQVMHSQATDSLLRPMMHRSDNFFAEQSLLMVANERLGVMNDNRIIDTLLKTDLRDLPQAPRWADGSGLSRYNLFTPQDFVTILAQMEKEFGMERLKNIFPAGGRGTLSNYYKADTPYLFAKTGSLSGVIALSGYLYSRSGKLLIFSVLVNNHRATATEVRRAVERFLIEIRNRE